MAHPPIAKGSAMSGLTHAEIIEAVQPSLRKQGRHRSPYGPLLLRLAGAFMPIFGAGALVGIVATVEHYSSRMTGGIPAFNSVAVWLPAAVCVMVISRLLFNLRERYRFVYSVVEISFAYCLAWLSLKQLATGASHWWSALLGAVYVFVRGFDNQASGLRQIKEREAAAAKVHPIEAAINALTKEQEKLLWAYKRKKAKRDRKQKESQP